MDNVGEMNNLVTSSSAENISPQMSGNVGISKITSNDRNKEINSLHDDDSIHHDTPAYLISQSPSNDNEAEKNGRYKFSSMRQKNESTKSDHVVDNDLSFSLKNDCKDFSENKVSSKPDVNISDGLENTQNLNNIMSCQFHSNNEIMPMETAFESNLGFKLKLEIPQNDHYKTDDNCKTDQSQHNENGSLETMLLQNCSSDSRETNEHVVTIPNNPDINQEAVLHGDNDSSESSLMKTRNIYMEISSSDDKREDHNRAADDIKSIETEETQSKNITEEANSSTCLVCETQMSCQHGGIPKHNRDYTNNDLPIINLTSMSSTVDQTYDHTFNSKSSLYGHRRNISLVIYSDSEESSSSDSEPESIIIEDNNDEDDFDSDIDESDSKVKKAASTSKHGKFRSRARTNGEIFPEELPPLDYLTISVPEELELVFLGKVSGIVDILVVIQALDNTPALYDDSVLFLENRSPLGLIFETIGTVHRPFYTVRFNSEEDIKERGITIGDKILYAPKADNLTKYIFISELRKLKCDDASWRNDNEAPEWAKEFSDDEEELMAMKSKKLEKRKNHDVYDQAEGGNKPHLKPGDLMRNPFGKRTEETGQRSVQPKIQSFRNQNSYDPNYRKRGSNRATHKAPNLFRKSGALWGRMGSSTSVPSFGDKPSWQPHPAHHRPMHNPTQPFPFDSNQGQVHGNEHPFHSFHSVGNVPPQFFPMPNVNPSIPTAIWPPDSNRAPILPRPPPMLNNFGLGNQMEKDLINNDVNSPLFSAQPTVFQPHMVRKKRPPNVPTPFRLSCP